MELLPREPDARWNRLLLLGLGFFLAWIALIVVAQIFGDNRDVKDDAALVIAAGGFISLLLGQYRHAQKVEATRNEVARAAGIAERVYEHVNHVEEQEAIPTDGEPEKPTLGSLLRQINMKVDGLQAQLDALTRATDVDS